MKKLIELFGKYCDEIVSDERFIVIAQDGTGYVESESSVIDLTFKDLDDLTYQLENAINRV